MCELFVMWLSNPLDHLRRRPHLGRRLKTAKFKAAMYESRAVHAHLPFQAVRVLTLLGHGQIDISLVNDVSPPWLFM